MPTRKGHDRKAGECEQAQSASPCGGNSYLRRPSLGRPSQGLGVWDPDTELGLGGGGQKGDSDILEGTENGMHVPSPPTPMSSTN